MQRPPLLTFASFLAVAENRSALLAIERLCENLAAGLQADLNPIYVHGPSGTGKTHLVSALCTRVIQQSPASAVSVLQAGDVLARRADGAGPLIDQVRHSDLLVIEDLQYVTATHAEELIALIDYFRCRQVPMVFTASVGPGQLELTSRASSRLASGLVIQVDPLQAASRLAFLQDRAQKQQRALRQDVLGWLADHVSGGGRQLEGALVRLDALVRSRSQAVDVACVAEHFRDLAEANRPTVDGIARKVGALFRVDLRDLRSARRGRHVVLPRQVGMYLARRLTKLSLEQIGEFFGGRDHSTVLHACRKVEHAVARDSAFSGAVRQLALDLG